MTSTTELRDHRAGPAQRGSRHECAALRLTGRGRVVLLLVLVPLLYAAFAAGRSASQAAVHPTVAPTLTQTTVQPGAARAGVAPARVPRPGRPGAGGRSATCPTAPRTRTA